MANQKVQLKSNNNNLFPVSAITGIDSSNLMATFNRGVTYTATQDCFIMFYYYNADGNNGKLKLDGNIIWNNWNAPNANIPTVIPLMKGQTFSQAQSDANKVYGVKYN